MSPSICTAAAVLAALVLVGCSDVSGPTDPSAAAPQRDVAPADNTVTTTSAPDSATLRGIHTIGGG